MNTRYTLPKNPVPLFDRKAIGYTDDLIDRVITELKQCPAIVEYLTKRSFDLSATLILEVDHTTSNEIRHNLNMHYSGKVSELGILLQYAQATITPQENKE